MLTQDVPTAFSPPTACFLLPAGKRKDAPFFPTEDQRCEECQAPSYLLNFEGALINC